MVTLDEFRDIIKELDIETDNEGNILPPPMTSRQAVDILQRHFLGDDWYAVNPMNSLQINTVIVYQILKRSQGKVARMHGIVAK